MYINTRNNAGITAIEFSPVENGTLACIHLGKTANAEQIRQLLAANGQAIIAQPQAAQQSVIIAQGSRPEQTVLKLLSEPGDTFVPYSEKKKMNPWAWRGGLSVAGQSLQLASGAFALSKDEIKAGKLKPAKFDLALIGFAIPNLIANIINYTFGAQKSEDVHGLAKIKMFVNEEVNKYLPENAQFDPAPNTIHKIAYEDATSADKKPGALTTFLKRYSVVFGEVGLRVLGSFSMAFSPSNWKAGFSELAKGNIVKAYEAGKTADKWTRYSGFGMLAGKFISFFPKIPDPNNPTPNNWLDNIREKYLFKASTAVEGIATSVLLVDRWRKKGLVINGKIHPEYYGLLGNLIFDIGYAVRWFAPFGQKVTDMKEVNAYILDGLKNVPEDKRAQAIATITLKLKQQLGDKIPPFGQVYSQLTADVNKYHPHVLSASEQANQETTRAATQEQSKKLRTSHVQRQNMQEIVANSRLGMVQAL